MQSITHNNFKGTNLIDENLPPNISPYSKNVDTEKGVASKRNGITSLVTSLGASGVNSLHEAKLSAGDTLVFGYSDKAYKLSGTQSTIAKTTTADFQAGTLNSNATVNDNISIKEYNKSQYDFSTQAEYDAWTKTDSVSYSSGCSGGIEFLNNSIHFYAQTGAGDGGYYGNTSAKISIDLTNINTLTFNYSFALWHSGETYSIATSYFKVGGVTKYTSSTPGTHTSTIDVSANTGLTEIELLFTINGSPSATFNANANSVKFNANSYTIDAEYISQSLDLGQTPEANKIAFNETEYTGQTVNVYTRGSHDNAIWGQWELKASNDAIQLTRYIQVKCVIPNSTDYVSHLTKPSLSDYTITYTPNLNQISLFDSGLTGNTIRWQNYGDNIYYTDGGQPKSYDNTTVKELGVNAPSATCTAAQGTATGLTGTYNYRITFIDSDGVESNSSPASNAITVSNYKINLSAIPTSTGMKRKIYRTKAGGSVYYFLTLINDTTTTIYTDSIADTTIEVSSGLLQTDNFKPPQASIVYEYKNYMFYVSSLYPNRLYFSKVYGTNTDYPAAAFEQVPDTNWKELPDNIYGVLGYQNKLIVTGDGFSGFFTGNIWGGENDNTSWYLVDDIGAVRHEAMVICQSLNGAICVLGTKFGIKYFTPSEYENGLEKLPLSYDVQPYFDNGVLDNMWLQFYNTRLYVGFIFYEGTPIAYNNTVLVYDFKRQVWDGPWTLSINDTAIFNGHMYGCGSNIGKVYEMLSGYSDDGADIHMIHDIKGDLGKYSGSVQRLKVQATTTSVADDLSIGIQVDGSAQTLSTGANTSWRKSADSFGKQDLMEKILSVKRRGTFYGLRIEDDSSNPIDINKIIVEFQGVKE